MDSENIEALIAGADAAGRDWSDHRAVLRANLTALSDRMADPELTGAELASLAREKRITMAELVALGDEQVEVSSLDEITARRARRRAGR